MSVTAKAVAQEVIKTVRKGKIPNISKIAIAKGYSPSSAKASKPQRTKAFQEVIKPFTDMLVEEREAAVRRMKQVRSKAKYRDLAYAADILTKNHQLLTGGATSNVALKYQKMSDEELEQRLNELRGEQSD